MEIIDFGLSPYRQVWEKQKEYQNEIIRSRKERGLSPSEVIMIGEHLPVYTIGFRGDISNLIANQEDLRDEGIECIRIERGGDITFHGPGQLILYPIIDLIQHRLGVRQYVEILEECVIRVLRSYNIKGERIPGATGVWLEKGAQNERKICAIGVKVSHGVTMHGLALNVNTNLKYFNNINPCGFVNKGVTSIKNEKKSPIDMEDLKDRIIKIFIEILEENC